jgi:hypothetical protein
MIVVASHNRVDLLSNVIKNLSAINLNNHEVLIVDTNSDDEEYKEFFKECEIEYPEILFRTLNQTCWDSGAYIYAYNTFDSNRYIFLQDSLEITNNNLIPLWDNFLSLYEVVPFINFGYFYESDEQKTWSEEGLNTVTVPKDSIFGPIFGVRRETLDKIPKEWLKVPVNKIQGCGMERRWSLMFHLLNCSKHYIEYTNFKKNHTVYTAKNNIDKKFFGRL